MGSGRDKPVDVILVEPNENQRLLYALELEDLGYRVIPTASGEGALDLLGGVQSSVVVLNTSSSWPTRRADDTPAGEDRTAEPR